MCHPERSAAESKDPVTATGSFDFTSLRYVSLRITTPLYQKYVPLDIERLSMYTDAVQKKA